MGRRLFIVLAFASLVGLLASALVYRVVTQMAGAPRQSDEQLVVAAVNMELAETITTRHVKLVEWPNGSVPPGAIRSIADAEGRVVRSSIVAGEPLLDGKLAPQLSGKGGIMPMLVPDGHRGITIKVDDAIKESGFVLPNSRVDVLVSMQKDTASQERISKVILQDVAVLAAGQTVELRDNKPVTITTVTLSLTPEQAERLALAQSEGRLMLATRNLRDNRVVRTAGATRNTLLTDGPPAPAEKPKVAKAVKSTEKPVPVAAAPLPVPKIEAHAVGVFRGTKLTEHVFVKDEGQSWVEQPSKK